MIVGIVTLFMNVVSCLFCGFDPRHVHCCPTVSQQRSKGWGSLGSLRDGSARYPVTDSQDGSVSRLMLPQEVEEDQHERKQRDGG